MDNELKESRIKPFTCLYSLRLTLGQAGHLISIYILTGTVAQQEVEGGGEITCYILKCLIVY